MKVTGKKDEFLKFVPSTQSNSSKKRIQLLRDDTYNCDVSHPKGRLCVVKEHYQKLGKERYVEAFDSDCKLMYKQKLKNLNNI